MAELFTDNDKFRPDIAAELTEPELRVAIAQLEVDHQNELARYIELKNANGGRATIGSGNALRDVGARLDALRSWMRVRDIEAGTRSAGPGATVTGD